MKTQIIINNLRVYPFSSKKEFLKCISQEKKIFIALNAEKIVRNNDKKLKNIINENIGYTDGIGAVLAVKQKGFDTIKLAGVELWLDIIKEFKETKSFYLIGGRQEIIEATLMRLKVEFPSIQICGFRNGFLKTEDEKNELITDLIIKKPDIIFVAIGSPKQEFLMYNLYKKYPSLYMGLGGSFDIYSGIKKRAPKLFIKLGLEWMFRLIQEPQRIIRQVILLKFFWLLLLKKF